MTWLLNHRQEILNLVTAPYESAVPYQKVLLASLYSYKLFTGGIRPKQSTEEVLCDLFNGIVNNSNNHSDQWKAIYAEIIQTLQLETGVNYSNKVRHFFSSAVGSNNPSNTEYIFVDAFKIITILNNMIEKYFRLNLERGIAHLCGTGFIKSIDDLLKLAVK